MSIDAMSEKEFKRAYRQFAAAKDMNLERLYQSYDRFNALYWEGGLPDVLIELSGGMGRRVLGRYYTATDYQCPNRIQINRDFYNMNSYSRVEKTLLHEMVHLWQHINKEKLGHNRSFREQAAKVGLKVEGRNCSTGAADMPPVKNRIPVWSCGCQVVRRKNFEAVCSKCGGKFERAPFS